MDAFIIIWLIVILSPCIEVCQGDEPCVPECYNEPCKSVDDSKYCPKGSVCCNYGLECCTITSLVLAGVLPFVAAIGLSMIIMFIICKCLKKNKISQTHRPGDHVISISSGIHLEMPYEAGLLSYGQAEPRSPPPYGEQVYPPPSTEIFA